MILPKHRPCRLLAAMVLLNVCATVASRAEEPVALRTGTHPLLDRSLIASTTGGVTHVLHRPVPREVVLRLDRPWEGVMSAYGTVVRDAEGKVRLYYRGGGDVDPPEVTCVAVSEDGVRFTRPNLGLYQVRGTPQNNVVFTAAPARPSYGESHNFAPFLDANRAAAPGQRWKATALRTGVDENGERRRMLSVLASADGLHWRPLAEEPVIRTGSFDSLNVAFFDAARGEYACYFRVGRGGLRSFAGAHSKDFLKWDIDQTPLVFRPPQDEQWYTNGVAPYPGVKGLYLALPMRFVPQRKTVGDPPRAIDGLSDAVLMTSRDGITWDRSFREAFLRPGPEAANWGDAHGNNTPLAGGLIATAPDEWSMYWFEGYGSGTPHIRRGTLRADGLASLHAGADAGEFLTPPLRLAHDDGEATPPTLRLNFATSATGSVRVEVLDDAGRPLEGRAADDCPELYGDELSRPVRWAAQTTLPADRTFRLRFLLRDADVYALTIR